jgi:hypothetical protein
MMQFKVVASEDNSFSNLLELSPSYEGTSIISDLRVVVDASTKKRKFMDEDVGNKLSKEKKSKAPKVASILSPKGPLSMLAKAAYLLGEDAESGEAPTVMKVSRKK